MRYEQWSMGVYGGVWGDRIIELSRGEQNTPLDPPRSFRSQINSGALQLRAVQYYRLLVQLKALQYCRFQYSLGQFCQQSKPTRGIIHATTYSGLTPPPI